MTEKAKLYPYWYILPALLFTGLTTFFPNLFSVILSFTNYSLYHFKACDWIGFDNYRIILASGELSTFLRVFWWTIVWAGVGVGSQLAVGLALALVLNRPNLKGRNFYRTLLIIPWAVPSFITVLMWTGLLNTEYGLVNDVIRNFPGLLPVTVKLVQAVNFCISLFNSAVSQAAAIFHLGAFKLQTFAVNANPAQGTIPWLTDGPWAKVGVLVVNLWLGFPFMMSISLGALQSIPSEVYEASSIDGATKVQQFFKIVLPLLRAPLLPVLISSFAFNFNNFVGIYLLTTGLPPVAGSAAGATDILVSYTYKMAFTLSKFGLACAYAVLIFLLIGSLSATNFKLTGAFDDRK
jgi:arabinogalactan oligomer/maltooligosaccharide transport system permease protein